ncbi:TPA: hypothetical protein ACSPKR_003521 [Providencia rettgeri]
MSEYEETENDIADFDDTTIRSTHYVDDGCDWTARIIHGIKQRCYIRMGICPPIPPAPQVIKPKITTINKNKRKKRK